MVQIVLTPEQSALLADAKGPVVLVNHQGQTVAHISEQDLAPSRFGSERLKAAAAKIGKDGPYVTTAELLAKLQRLDTQQ